MFGWQFVSRILFATALAGSLAACTQSGQSVTATLEQPAESAPRTTGQQDNVTANSLSAEAGISAGQTRTEGQISTDGQQVASLTEDAIAVLPLEGAPQTAMGTLSRSLRNAALQRGLNLQVNSQAGTPYRIKGYFSALNDGSGTLLVYVWDVLDRSGKRVHRINGQERNGSSRSDPWLAITEEELGRVAERTVAGLKAWVETKKS